jgi:hypothetical protein
MEFVATIGSLGDPVASSLHSGLSKESPMNKLVTVAALLTLISPLVADPCDYPETLGEDPSKFETFYDGPEERLYYGEYTGLPKTLTGVNPGDTKTLIRGTIGISYDAVYESYVLVQLEQVETVTASGHSYVETYRQTVFFEEDDTRESSRRLRLKEKAALFSVIGERETLCELNKRDNTGKVRMRFWHGGRIGGSPYSDDTHEFTWEKVDSCTRPTPGASTATGVVGALGGL